MGYRDYLKRDCFDIDRYLSDKKQEFEEQLSKIEDQAKYIRQWVKSRRNDMKKIVQDNEKELKILFKNRSLKENILRDIQLFCSGVSIGALEESVRKNIGDVCAILKNSEKDFEEAKKKVEVLERYN